MREYRKFFINGKWVEPAEENPFEVINPATEEACAHISLGGQADVDAALGISSEAAKKALFQPSFQKFMNWKNPGGDDDFATSRSKIITGSGKMTWIAEYLESDDVYCNGIICR